MSEMHTCTKCGTPKPSGDFYADKRSTKQIKAECKDCIKSRMKDWRKRNPEKVKAQNERRRKIDPA
jgi:hypothetical protein